MDDMGQESTEIEELSKRKIIILSHNFLLSKMTISEVSLNIFLALLSEIKIEDKTLRPYDIPVGMLENKLGKELNKNRRELNKIVSDLSEKNLLLYNDMEAISLCSECEIINEDNILYMSIVINPLLEEEFISLDKNFTKINLQHILNLRGFYAKRIYMLLTKMGGIGHWNPSIDQLHSILVTPSSYGCYSNFKQRVIEPSLRQINLLVNPEIKVSYKEDKRSSRRVKTLKFKIEKMGNSKKKIKKSNNRFRGRGQISDDWDDFSKEDIEKNEEVKKENDYSSIFSKIVLNLERE